MLVKDFLRLKYMRFEASLIFCTIQVLVLFSDLHLDILFHPIPLFPVYAGYATGLLIQMGLSTAAVFVGERRVKIFTRNTFLGQHHLPVYLLRICHFRHGSAPA